MKRKKKIKIKNHKKEKKAYIAWDFNEISSSSDEDHACKALMVSYHSSDEEHEQKATWLMLTTYEIMVFLVVSMYGWGRYLTQKDPKKIGYLDVTIFFVGTWRSYASIVKSRLILQDTRSYDMVVSKSFIDWKDILKKHQHWYQLWHQILEGDKCLIFCY